jgi:hypothetical protein
MFTPGAHCRRPIGSRLNLPGRRGTGLGKVAHRLRTGLDANDATVHPKHEFGDGPTTVPLNPEAELRNRWRGAAAAAYHRMPVLRITIR